MGNALVLTAAGNSTRMGGPFKKEYLTVSTGAEGTVSVLSSALFSFLSTRLFAFVVVTVPVNGEDEARQTLARDSRIAPLLENTGIALAFTEGGTTRQSSVKNGLAALRALSSAAGNPNGPEIVLIHDGARPWIRGETIEAVLAGVRLHGAAVPALESVDTQKETDRTGKIIRHLDRSLIVSVQTPQGFLFAPLFAAHQKAALDGRTYTDDTEIWGRYEGDVYICPGDRENRKITYQGDL